MSCQITVPIHYITFNLLNLNSGNLLNFFHLKFIAVAVYFAFFGRIHKPIWQSQPQTHKTATTHHITSKRVGWCWCVSYNSTLVSYLFDYHLVNLLFFFLYILFTVSLPFIIAFTFVHVPTLTVNYITMVIVVCSRRVTFKTLNSFAIKEKYCGLSLLFLGRTNLFSVTIKLHVFPNRFYLK